MLPMETFIWVALREGALEFEKLQTVVFFPHVPWTEIGKTERSRTEDRRKMLNLCLIGSDVGPSKWEWSVGRGEVHWSLDKGQGCDPQFRSPQAWGQMRRYNPSLGVIRKEYHWGKRVMRKKPRTKWASMNTSTWKVEETKNIMKKKKGHL